MPWKTDDKGQLALTERGNPVFTDDSGEERECDFPAMSRKLRDNGKEAQARKDEIKALRSRLAPLDEAGVEDVAAWLAEHGDLKAQAAARKDSDGKGEAERTAALKAELEKGYAAREAGLKAQLAEMNGRVESLGRERDGLRETLGTERLQRQFFDSQFAREKCNPPADVLYTLFKDRCGWDEEGRFQGRDSRGELLYGASGDPAGFDEWLADAVKGHKYADSFLLRGGSASGAGSSPVSGDGRGPNPWDAKTLDITAQMRLMTENPGLAQRFAKEAGQTLEGMD
ncbi:MAG: hypothetical protein LBG06_10145 [Deltaproteobacteria bacterium]|nr:hypothetical protein [Deltaproteobacteria bacterium]